MSVRVPQDHPTLAAALETGAEHILLEGEHEGETLVLDRPVHIEGVGEGSSYTVTGTFICICSADARIENLRLVNLQGHGIRAKDSAAPAFHGLTIHVGGVALAADGQTRPELRSCKIERCGNGMELRGQTVPDVDEVLIVAGKGCMVFHDQSAGTFRNMGLLSGAFAAVETLGTSAPIFETGAIAGSGGGGFFVHGESKPRVAGFVFQNIKLAAVEVTEQADPIFDGLQISDTYGSALFIHGQAAGTYMDVTVRGPVVAGIDVSESAKAELENVSVWGGHAQGLWIHDEARVEVLGLKITHCRLAAVDVEGKGVLQIEDGHFEDNRDHGFYLRNSAQVAARRCTVRQCDTDGAYAKDAATLRWEGGSCTANGQAALRAHEAAQIQHRDLEIDGPIQTGAHGKVERIEA
jgi:hypothetical protein